MLQQILETQQSRIQMETLINFGAAQITMTTSDVHDFQTKAFCEMRGVKVTRMLGRVGFISSVWKLRDVSARWLRSWIGTRSTDFRIRLSTNSCAGCEEQRRTIEKSHQSKVHGSGDASMYVDALPKTKGARRAVKGRTCGP